MPVHRLRDWAAGLPQDLLHCIIRLLGSFPDLVAFAATCHSWRSAFSSLCSPLLLQPNVPFCSPRPLPNAARSTFVPKRPCYATDLGSQENTLLCSQIPLLSNSYRKDCPPGALDGFFFIGASFGHMIISNNRYCVVSDVFTGIDVSSPLLRVGKHYTADIYFDAALTAPPSSPNSHLIVSTGSHNFFWRVGSNSWLKRSSLDGSILTKFAVLKGQVVAMDSNRRLFLLHLTPQIRLQRIPVRWGGNSMREWHLRTLWLVACGEMLLMVQSSSPGAAGDVFEVYRLDNSIQPAEWVKVDRLENWAIFISKDERVQALPCMNPERKGWRSNCVYCYDYDQCVVFELGKPLTQPGVSISMCCSRVMQPMWVVPSVFSSCLL